MPISPLHADSDPSVEELFGPTEGYEQAEMAPDIDGNMGTMTNSEAEALGDERHGQKPIAVPSPGSHTKEEYQRHCLTHYPYRNWCPHCVKGQKHNAAHRSKPTRTREIPLLAVDYCFVRDEEDGEALTLLVGKMEPYKAFVALPVDMKGTGDTSVITRLAGLISE